MVERTRVVARYPPMMPVKIAATAVTVITARAAVPIIDFAAKKVGTDAIPLSPSSAAIYSCQEENPSGTAATLTSTMAIYANPAARMARTSIPPDFFVENLKCAVSKAVTSKPTNAHGDQHQYGDQCLCEVYVVPGHGVVEPFSGCIGEEGTHDEEQGRPVEEHNGQIGEAQEPGTQKGMVAPECLFGIE